jgi:NAD(P)-dependent dehydrogenase (short-subunit alcohol dehydrogenase family)
MDLFKDKVAIVTGGASGIGKALGRELLARGAAVVLADINAEALAGVVESMAAAGGGVRGARVDVIDPEAVRALVAETVKEHGRLDYMFNNAGAAVAAEVRNYERRDWTEIVDLDLYGVINGVAAAYPVMVEQGHGHIVNTASIAGLIPFPGGASYAASKHAVVGLSLTLRTEATALGVKVSVACPGLIDTPIWRTNREVGFDQQKALATLPAKLASVRRCAREVLAGVEKNRPIIVVTKTAKFLWYLQRLSPAAMLWYQTRQMERYRDVMGAGT